MYKIIPTLPFNNRRCPISCIWADSSRSFCCKSFYSLLFEKSITLFFSSATSAAICRWQYWYNWSMGQCESRDRSNHDNVSIRRPLDHICVVLQQETFKFRDCVNQVTVWIRRPLNNEIFASQDIWITRYSNRKTSESWVRWYHKPHWGAEF